MTSDDLKARCRRWFDEVWNQGREATVQELMTSDCIVHGLGVPDTQAPRGPQAFIPFYRDFRQTFPDIRIQVDDVVCESNQTVARISFEATHAGPGMIPNLAPTNRRVRATGLIMARWSPDGRIAEAWNEFDAAGVIAQITAA